MNSFRVGTWNLDGYGARASQRWTEQTTTLLDLAAEVLVLTEVRDDAVLPGMTHWWSAPGQPPYKQRDRAVGIASIWPGTPLDVSDDRLSVCVALDAPDPLPRVIVYGTVIPYKFDGVRQGAAAVWARHREAARHVVNDIRRLRAEATWRDAHLILAGDFNTNLDNSTWYGDAETRVALVEGLEGAGLVCHTTEDLRVRRGSDRAIVDHVWASAQLKPKGDLYVWCDKAEPGRQSDHNGVALNLEAAR